MKWTVVAPLRVNPETGEEIQEVHAGWSHKGKVDGWSIWLEVTKKSPACVEGFMKFPERAAFEFDGDFKQMLKTMRKTEGGRGLFAQDKFVFWRL